jgi:hypothetical protein
VSLLRENKIKLNSLMRKKSSKKAARKSKFPLKVGQPNQLISLFENRFLSSEMMMKITNI